MYSRFDFYFSCQCYLKSFLRLLFAVNRHFFEKYSINFNFGIHLYFAFFLITVINLITEFQYNSLAKVNYCNLNISMITVDFHYFNLNFSEKID